MNLFIFHNDLRLYDNTALSLAIENGPTIPIFIFTPTQIGSDNKYRSQMAINFMCNCLVELDKQLRKKSSKLHVYYGDTIKIISKLLDNYDFKAIYSNSNYTPFAVKRDNSIKNLCKQYQIPFICVEDYALFPVGSIKTSNGQFYKKFTPYYNIAVNTNVSKSLKYSIRNLKKISNGSVSIMDYGDSNYDLGGRKQALKILDNIDKFKNYSTQRDILAINTTQLSAYIKFGCISIREAYWSFKKTDPDLVKQLIWRDFYINLVWGYPYILVGKNRNFKQKYSLVKWKRGNSVIFQKWCQGKTGFPIVDASMRQLNISGWMHNRGRLIVAWFLTKIMGWHWEEGELYFATKLRDYDPAQNNGGWQFCSGSGVDTDQYFRQFNPWSHSKKFDPDGTYIKHWIPELKKVLAKDLHQWDKSYNKYPTISYPKPMINYEKAKIKIKKIYGYK